MFNKTLFFLWALAAIISLAQTLDEFWPAPTTDKEQQTPASQVSPSMALPSIPACSGCDPAEGFCAQCREKERRLNPKTGQNHE